MSSDISSNPHLTLKNQGSGVALGIHLPPTAFPPPLCPHWATPGLGWAMSLGLEEISGRFSLLKISYYLHMGQARPTTASSFPTYQANSLKSKVLNDRTWMKPPQVWQVVFRIILELSLKQQEQIC